MTITIKMALYFTVLTMILFFGAAEAISGPEYDALATAQRAAGNTSERLTGTYYLDITNATSDLMPKISPGEYDSTSYVIPVGPYEVSFQLRSSLNIFGVGYTTFNRTTGSGKTYHQAEYEQYTLYMEDYHHILPDFIDIVITRYKGPSEFPPEDPMTMIEHVPRSQMLSLPTPISIDGHSGTCQELDSSNSGNTLAWISKYNLDSSTFVTMKSTMNWDKDTALAIETMHITKSGH